MCSNRAVSTLREGDDDATTGIKAAFFMREYQVRRKRRKMYSSQRKRQ